MNRHLTFAILFGLLAMPGQPASAQLPGSIVWDNSNPEAVRREIAEIALQRGDIRIVLDNGSAMTGIIGRVGDEDFVVGTREARDVTVNFASVRGVYWTGLRETKASRIRSTAQDLANHSGVVARVRLRNHPEMAGNITEARQLSFTFVDQQSAVGQQLDYRDVERISAPGIAPKLKVSEIFQNIAIGLLMLPLFPLMLLIGWDGC
jgi:hypothetical protein